MHVVTAGWKPCISTSAFQQLRISLDFTLESWDPSVGVKTWTKHVLSFQWSCCLVATDVWKVSVETSSSSWIKAFFERFNRIRDEIFNQAWSSVLQVSRSSDSNHNSNNIPLLLRSQYGYQNPANMPVNLSTVVVPNQATSSMEERRATQPHSSTLTGRRWEEAPPPRSPQSNIHINMSYWNALRLLFQCFVVFAEYIRCCVCYHRLSGESAISSACLCLILSSVPQSDLCYKITKPSLPKT